MALIEHVESLEHSTTASSGKSKKGPMYGRGAQVKNDGMATFAPSFFYFLSLFITSASDTFKREM